MGYPVQQDGAHVELLHQLGLGVFVGQLLSSGLFVWLLWGGGIVSHHSLIAWELIFVVILLGRWAEFKLFHMDRDRRDRSNWWRKCFTVGAALTGLAWGYAGWSFFEPKLEFLLPATLLLTSQLALSVPSVGIYFPAHAVFNITAMSPFLVRNLLVGENFYYGHSVGLFTLMVASLVFSWRQERTIRESIRLRFANSGLLQELTQENAKVSEAHRQAEAANLAKSRFLAAASHDLRQPLQAINLFVDALSQANQKGQTPPPGLISKLSNACQNMGDLFDALLDLSQVEATVAPSVRDVPLQPLFDRIRHEFVDQAAACGLAMRVVATPHHVRTDPALLERILRNLISNALRYTREGGILVGCRVRGDRLRIEVRDSGIGIPREALPHIFTPLFQVGNSERDSRKGLGLGLAIVSTLARQIGSRVEVRSVPGCGSVFHIDIPIGQAAPETSDPAHPPEHNLQGRWVIVMDDEAMVRDGIVAVLRPLGCLVTEAENAQDIITTISALAPTDPDRLPDAILADWRLRDGRNGAEEARKLLAHFGTAIPTVLLTGETLLDPVLAEGLPILHKPILGFRLRAQLDALLN